MLRYLGVFFKVKYFGICRFFGVFWEDFIVRFVV